MREKRRKRKKGKEKEGERWEINLHCSIHAHYTIANTMDIHA